MEDRQRKYASIREAAKLVHRKLGTSKRFSEFEKVSVTQLLAAQLTDLQNRQTDELDIMKRRVVELAEENQNKQELTGVMYNDLTQFVKSHSRQLTTHAHNMSTTTDVLMKMKNRQDDEKLVAFCESLKLVLGQISNAYTHREVLFYEIDKCLHMVGSSAHLSMPAIIGTAAGPGAALPVGRRRHKVFSLYELLKRRRTASGFVKDNNLSPDKKSVEIKQLTSRVDELRMEIIDYNIVLEEMRCELEQADAELMHLRALAASTNGYNGTVQNINNDLDLPTPLLAIVGMT